MPKRYKIFDKVKHRIFYIGGQQAKMDPNVVALPDKTPLTVNFNWALPEPLGWITDIKVEDGDITGVVVLHKDSGVEEMLDNEAVELGGYYINIEKTEEGDFVIVTKATLRGVSIVFNEGYPRGEAE